MNQAALLRKYLNGSITEAEADVLFAHIRSNNGVNADWEDVLESTYHQSLKEEPALSRKEHAEMLTRLLQDVQRQEVIKPIHRVHFMRKWGWAAAVVLCVLATGAYFWFAGTEKSRETSNQSALVLDVAPGKEGAVLTLADGTQMVLDSAGNGIIAHQQGAQVMLLNNQLSYQHQAGMNADEGSREVYNTMRTPRGRQFQLVLPDGSRVWLNAASSIQFPVAFTGKERKVIVTGEVYFEVVQSAKQPFIVTISSPGQETSVEVLGTSFNINAYTDETTIKTTLVEGAVRVVQEQKERYADNNQAFVILKPGQQADVKRNGQESGKLAIDVQEINTDDVLAWKNGLFAFTDADIQTVMRQLSRWYDIEVRYEGGIPKRTFNGKIGKMLTLDQVLKGLTKMRVQYRIEAGNRITIFS